MPTPSTSANSVAPRTREQQAHEEVGVTEISRGAAGWLSALFLLLVGGVPLVQWGGQLLRSERPAALSQDRAPPVRQASSVGQAFSSLQPQWAALDSFESLNDLWQVLPSANDIQGVERALEENSFLHGLLHRPVQGILTEYGGVGNERVWIGREGWMFYRPAVECLTGPPFLDPRVLKRRRREGSEWEQPPQPDPVLALVDFHRQLADRGIALLVVPVPVKAAIHPEKLSKRFESVPGPLGNSSDAEFLRRLDDEGVAVLDLNGRLDELAMRGAPTYLRTDTHWAPHTVESVSQWIADWIHTNRAHRDHSEESRVSQPREVSPWQTQQESVEGLGDVAGMLDLPSWSLEKYKESCSLRRVMDSQGRPWAPDPEARVLLLGDSYTNIYSLEGLGWGTCAGLAEQLSERLGEPLDRIAVNDQGAHAARQRLANQLRRGEDRLANKQVVVYEFSARELSWGDWKLFDLSLGERDPSDSKELAPFVGSGVVAAVTPVPTPGSVPYRDAVMSVHVTELSPPSPRFPKGEAVVFAWGMVDNQVQPSAWLESGDSVSLNLRSWSAVEEEVGGYHRLELPGDQFFDLPETWAESLRPPSEEDWRTREAAQADLVAAPMREEDSRDQNLPATDPRKDQTPASKPDELERLVQSLRAQKQMVVVGEDGWMFFRPELEFLVAGKFWGERAQLVSASARPQDADPLPAILDFHRQLESQGVELLMVPVPAKATIYPEYLPADLSSPMTEASAAQEFLQRLRQSGVSVLDLTETYLAAKSEGDRLYCQQDTHWSPRGVRLAAQQIADWVKEREEVTDEARRQYVTETRELTIRGDLLRLLADSSASTAGEDPLPPPESFSLSIIREATPDGAIEVVPDRDSPLLLLGDSHTLVYHVGGDLHGTGAGLPEALAQELAMAPDVVGVRGSGSTAARMNLARRRDNLTGKRLVVWVFTVREFTQSAGGWRPIPVIR